MTAIDRLSACRGSTYPYSEQRDRRMGVVLAWVAAVPHTAKSQPSPHEVGVDAPTADEAGQVGLDRHADVHPALRYTLQNRSGVKGFRALASLRVEREGTQPR